MSLDDFLQKRQIASQYLDADQGMLALHYTIVSKDHTPRAIGFFLTGEQTLYHTIENSSWTSGASIEDIQEAYLIHTDTQYGEEDLLKKVIRVLDNYIEVQEQVESEPTIL